MYEGKIEAYRIIKDQKVSFKKNVVLIFSLNNLGKTTMLEAILKSHVNKLYLNSELLRINLIDVRRMNASQVLTKNISIQDNEEYRRRVLAKPEFHLNQLKDKYLVNIGVKKFLSKGIKALFGIKTDDFEILSDGIKNIVNICLEIIWTLTWDREINEFSDLKSFYLGESIILIDEIENYLHLSVQQKLLDFLSSNFPNTTFVLTTHSSILISRFRDLEIYTIKNGKLKIINDDLYYKDMDDLLLGYFNVLNQPEESHFFIDYFSKLINRKIAFDNVEFERNMRSFKNEFPNIYSNYENKIKYIRGMLSNADV